MSIQQIKKSQLQTTTWAGGTTTQLAIYPATAEYKSFNFDFRISYATVEVPESTFTFMPGVTRHLMILKGSLEINHIDRYQKTLEKFDLDIFNGEWPTKAKGRVSDFNLMTRGTTSGSLESLILPAGISKALSINEKHSHTGLYLLSGRLTVKLKTEDLKMEAGDFILFNKITSQICMLTANTTCEIIVSTILLAE